LNKYILAPTIIALYAFFMWRCYNLVTMKKLNTGIFVSLFLIMMSLMGSLSRYVNQTKELVSRRGVIEASLNQISDNDNEKNAAGGNQQDMLPQKYKDASERHPPNIPKDNIVYFDRVTYMYKGSKNPILHAITLGIAQGQRVLIKGRIGCGKSTLLRLLMKYKVPQLGEIYLGHKPYSQLSAKMVRSIVGYVPQTAILFNRSIYENITYGVNNVSKEDVIKMLTHLGLSHIFDTFPEGIDANVGKNGNKLSGGQRQIVWILRVLLQDPTIILMDEPTASIDDKTKDTVRELLGEVMKSRTVIMVTHDDYLETFADRIIELKDGEVIKDTLIDTKHHAFY
jgi:ABC-type bacteriocin/lantibiotic exporter with double-glycine peptidase domain